MQLMKKEGLIILISQALFVLVCVHVVVRYHSSTCSTTSHSNTKLY